MVGVEWSDGTQVFAPDWEALFNQVRESQWTAMPPQHFRAEMAKRAIRWSNTRIDPWLPHRKFFMELERARMLMVIATTEERSD